MIVPVCLEFSGQGLESYVPMIYCMIVTLGACAGRGYDSVCALMCDCNGLGARAQRNRQLRKEIALLRRKINQQVCKEVAFSF